jgi:hypothetical protein
MVLSADPIADVAGLTFHARRLGKNLRDIAPLVVFNGQPCMGLAFIAIV